MLVGMQNGADTLENHLGVPQKVNYRVIIWPSILTAGINLREIKTMSRQKLVQNIHRSIIYNRQKLETTQNSPVDECIKM